MTVDRFLPPGLRRTDIRICLGLVSDTHMPERCTALPAALFDALSGCDLLLHAGDVGELWVLDLLSAIAPVIAVHGNDDSPDAQRSLPYSAVLSAAGERVFLWHSHFPDPAEEHASRLGDDLLPKLERTREAARSAGARLAVFGHWHIPLAHTLDGVTVANPGAIASGNNITRRLVQTAAAAWLLHDGTWRITHVDLNAPDAPYDPGITWADGFTRTLARFERSILDPALAARLPILLPRVPKEMRPRLRALLNELARPVWAGEAPLITVEALRRASAGRDFSPAEIALLAAIDAPPPEDPAR